MEEAAMTDAIDNTDKDVNALQSSGPNPHTDSAVDKTSARRSKSKQRNRSTELTMADAVNTINKETNTPTDSGPHTSRSDVGPLSIPKPSEFSLNKFKSTHPAAVAGVETLSTGLPHHKIALAKDFVRLHPDEATYWSPELCFVNVPIKGQKRDTLHLINEDLAMRYLPSGKIQHFRLALATKPDDAFFLCEVPTRNEDNSWNANALLACEKAKTTWIQATSRKEEGVDGYKIDLARDPDAFPAPKWPNQSLSELINKTFAGRMIEQEDHPALLRLIGAKQAVQ
jgi:hypothetical protein